MEIVNLAVNPQQFNTIMAGLEELPHKVSRGVIDALVQQVQAQTAPKPAPAPEPAPAAEPPIPESSPAAE